MAGTAKQLEFHALGRRDVVGNFDGGQISSNGGCFHLRLPHENDRGKLQGKRLGRSVHAGVQWAKNQARPFTELKKLSGLRCECFDDNAALKNGLKWLGRTAFR